MLCAWVAVRVPTCRLTVEEVDFGAEANLPERHWKGEQRATGSCARPADTLLSDCVTWPRTFVIYRSALQLHAAPHLLDPASGQRHTNRQRGYLHAPIVSTCVRARRTHQGFLSLRDPGFAPPSPEGSCTTTPLMSVTVSE